VSAVNPPTITPVVRLAHLSDIHISARPLGWRLDDYVTKRWTGWINYRWLGRRHRFRGAEQALAAIVEELVRRRPDHVIFSGDAVALGFEAEFARAAALIRVGDPAMPPGLAVPGNHDYYTRGTGRSGLFEKYFAAWQRGERIDGAIYPFAQRVGHVWLIAVNSATGNWWPLDAAGSVGPEQLDRLRRLLARLDPGPRILVTHYPICHRSGRPENHWHCLRDAADLLIVAAEGKICLWLHGHQHGAYYLNDSRIAPFPIINAGSATEVKRYTYNEYTIRGMQLQAMRRRYLPEERRFEDGVFFEMELR